MAISLASNCINRTFHWFIFHHPISYQISELSIIKAVTTCTRLFSRAGFHLSEKRIGWDGINCRVLVSHKKVPHCQGCTTCGLSSFKFPQNFILKTRMLCFSRHSRQKCRKRSFLRQKRALFSIKHQISLTSQYL